MGALDHLNAPQGPTCGTILQPSHLAHTRPASSLVWTRAWRVLCALVVHKPAHDHGQYHAHVEARIFFFATEVTQGPLSSVRYTHIKHTPKSRCAICSGIEDTTKMRAHGRGTCLADLAADLTQETLPTAHYAHIKPTVHYTHVKTYWAIVKCPLYAHKTHTKVTLRDLQWL